MNGVINLDKPPGISSAAAVGRIKRLLPPRTKIGHAGTLDPFATGVLLILIGSATRASQRFMDQPKRYQATVELGATTPTDDPESPPTPVPAATAPPLEVVQSAVAKWIGTPLQRPPDFSAMKVGGRRAYRLARRGQAVDLPARPVRIDAIAIAAYHWPFLSLVIDCGKGTYIRSLARDLGAQLGTGGYLTQLRRLKIGGFAVASAVTIDRLASEGVAAFLQPIDRI
jgi:tRNA pseudouridine55 synthase